MCKLILSLIFVLFTYFVSAQNKDLVVTIDGDSIACDILEVNDSEIILTMKYGGRNNVKTNISLEKIIEYKYNVIQEDLYSYRSGTSYIIRKIYPISRQTYSISNLQNASNEELEYYRYKAQKFQKTGKILSIAGAITLGVDAVLLFATDDGLGIGGGMGEGMAMFIFTTGVAGLTSMTVGIPKNIKGKKRVKRINNLERNSLSGYNINLTPEIRYNQFTQNYHPALSLNIRF